MASCKKETVSPVQEQQPGGVAKSTRVKSIAKTSASFPAETVKMTYDASGRVATCTDNYVVQIFSYQSATDLLVTRKNVSDNSLHSTLKCTLNDKGAITQMIQKDASNVTQFIINYEYTPEGYLKYTKTDAGNHIYEDKYTIVNDNPTNCKTYVDAALFTNTNYSINPLIKWSLPYNQVQSDWPVPFLYGKPFKNAITDLMIYKANGTVFEHQVFSYQLNAVDDIIKIDDDRQVAGVKVVNNFTVE